VTPSLALLEWEEVRYAYGSRASSRGNHRLMWLNHEVFTTNPTSAWIQRGTSGDHLGLKGEAWTDWGLRGTAGMRDWVEGHTDKKSRVSWASLE
jgi:hypothetical protein